MSYGNAKGRITTVTLQLRATTKGPLADWEDPDPPGIPPRGGGTGRCVCRSRQRRDGVRSPEPNPPGAGAGASAQGSPPAAISVVVSDPSVVVGQQVDVVTIAWFQRDLRQQLRRSPTVEAPRIEGVWSYPQQVPSGIAASRLIGGRWYDLFILHQIIFPLTPGTVKVSAARLHYSVPLAFQFFSQEERYSLASGTSGLEVTPLPTAGRPADFTGAVARNLTVTDSISPPVAQQGKR